MRTFTPIVTADGSHTLKIEELNETYHSTHGALQESQYVYIEKGLVPLLAEKKQIRILEVGLGTGLNALLTLLHLQENPESYEKIHYVTLEPFPIPEAVLAGLNLTQFFEENTAQFFAKIHAEDVPAFDAPELSFHFERRSETLQSFTPPTRKQGFDLVYYDAFAPSKQPEMWEQSVFDKLHALCNPGALLVTYCASGQFKRNLKAAGFEAETLAGPPGKKQMTRGRAI